MHEPQSLIAPHARPRRSPYVAKLVEERLDLRVVQQRRLTVGRRPREVGQVGRHRRLPASCQVQMVGQHLNSALLLVARAPSTSLPSPRTGGVAVCRADGHDALMGVLALARVQVQVKVAQQEVLHVPRAPR